MNEWISVKDSLPCDGKRYPVSVNGIPIYATHSIQGIWLDDQFGEVYPTFWCKLSYPPDFKYIID